MSWIPCTLLSAPITARTPPETCHSAITKPNVTQNSWCSLTALVTTSSISANAGCDTLAFTSGASSLRQTSSRCRKPSSPKPNISAGTSADRIWNEIALA